MTRKPGRDPKRGRQVSRTPDLGETCAAGNPGEVTAELRCRGRRLVFASDTRRFPESPSDCASGARCAATSGGEEEEGEEEEGEEGEGEARRKLRCSSEQARTRPRRAVT